MSGFLFDTNVLLDIATADETWLAWSEEQFRTAPRCCVAQVLMQSRNT